MTEFKPGDYVKITEADGKRCVPVGGVYKLMPPRCKPGCMVPMVHFHYTSNDGEERYCNCEGGWELHEPKAREVNKAFVVGKHYRLRKEHPLSGVGGTITFDRRTNFWSHSMMPLADRNPREVTQVINYGVGATISGTKFGVTFKGIEGIWSCYPEDFEEVNVEKEYLRYQAVEKEEKKMELKNIKTKNLKEAKKQFDNERANAEIEFARGELRRATDELDRLDREIKAREEQKKPWLETVAKFS